MDSNFYELMKKRKISIDEIEDIESAEEKEKLLNRLTFYFKIDGDESYLDIFVLNQRYVPLVVNHRINRSIFSGYIVMLENEMNLLSNRRTIYEHFLKTKTWFFTTTIDNHIFIFRYIADKFATLTIIR